MCQFRLAVGPVLSPAACSASHGQLWQLRIVDTMDRRPNFIKPTQTPPFTERGQASCVFSSLCYAALPVRTRQNQLRSYRRRLPRRTLVRGQPADPSVPDEAMRQELPVARPRSLAIHGEEKSPAHRSGRTPRRPRRCDPCIAGQSAAD